MMKSFLVAAQFLTSFPISIRSQVSKEDMGKSLSYFPLVGSIIGLILAGLSAIFVFLPPPVNAAIILIASIILTGGIHLDGFADTCDGFLGSRSRDRILEIMRDSRIGTMGAIGVAWVLLLKFSILSSMPSSLLWRSLILATTFARWSQVLACRTSKYARSEGKAQHFIENAGKKELFAGTLFTLALSFFLFGLKGLLIFFICLLPVFLALQYIKSRIGGMTGDTVGAVSEIAEASVFLFALIYR